MGFNFTILKNLALSSFLITYCFIVDAQNLCTDGASTNGIPTATDYDGDGINDGCDLDDDNDGILDENECFSLSSSIVTDGGFSVDNPSGWYRSTIDSGFESVVGNVSTYATTNKNSTLTGGLFDELGGDNSETGLQNILYELNSFTNAIVYNISGGQLCSGIYEYSFDLGSRAIGNASTEYVVQIWDADADTVYTELERDFFSTLTPYSATPNFSTYSGTFTLNHTGNFYILFRGTGTGSTPDDYIIDRVAISSNSIIGNCCDTDNDGIFDSLDLDSDGDGCPDAIEGGGSFTTNDLISSSLPGGNSGGTYTGTSSESITSNLGNNVDTDETSLNYGVPVSAGGGQTIGSSQDVNTQDPDCFNLCTDGASTNGMPTATDYDGDGINDECDLDDDNDGIVDTLECVPFVVETFSLDPNINYLNNTGTGTAFMNVLDTNNDTIAILEFEYYGFTQQPTFVFGTNNGYVTTNMVYELPNITGHQFGYSVTSNNAVINDVIHLLQGPNLGGSLPGRVENGDYTYNHTISDNVIVTNTTAANSYVPSGVISVGDQITSGTVISRDGVTGTNDFLDVQFAMNCGETFGIDAVYDNSLAEGRESVGFSFGVFSNCLNVCDLDGDGIPNDLDLDSDGDGCPDAIEGGGSFTTNDMITSSLPGGNSGGTYTGTSPEFITSNLGNNVDTDETSLNYGVPVSAGVGQTIGSSQDVNTQDPDCFNLCTDGASTNGMPTATDYDGDGINDECDLDDDNDGILDTDEDQICGIDYIVPATFLPVDFVTGQNGSANGTFNYDDNAGISGYGTWELTYSRGPDGTGVLNNVGTGSDGRLSVQTTGTAHDDIYNFTITSHVETGTITGNTFGVTLYGNTELYSMISIYDYYILDFDGIINDPQNQISNYNTGDIYNALDTFNQSVDVNNSVLQWSITSITPNVSSFSLTALNGNILEGFGMSFNVVAYDCSQNDLDGDGIVNSLDLDSDGDGCPDAIEGGGSFTTNDMISSSLPGGNSGGTYTGTSSDSITDNLGNNVDTDETSLNYGIPFSAGIGQTIGSSQDVNTQDPDCFNPCTDGASTNGMPTATDYDGDGINDECDLDDDNDGILDDLEKGCAFETLGFIPTNFEIFKYDLGTGFYTTPTPSLPAGNLTLTATYTPPIPGKIQWPTTLAAEHVSTYVPAGEINWQNGYTNESVVNITIFRAVVPDCFSEVEQTITRFGVDGGTNIWLNDVLIAGMCCGDEGGAPAPQVTTYTISGGDVIEFRSVNGIPTHQGTNFEFTEAVTGQCGCVIDIDTDSDGIPDFLDLDSDGDGCPDAIEGDGSFTSDDMVSSSLPGGNTGGAYTGSSTDLIVDNLGNNVDTDETSSNYGVPLSVGGGQGIGSSQDGNVQDPDCIDPCIDGASIDGFPTATDYDGDGINDECDLDDDNDGILDVDEDQVCVSGESLSTTPDGMWQREYWSPTNMSSHWQLPIGWNGSSYTFFTDLDKCGLPVQSTQGNVSTGVPYSKSGLGDGVTDIVQTKGFIVFPDSLIGQEINVRMRAYSGVGLHGVGWTMSYDNDICNWVDPVHVETGEPLLDMNQTLGYTSPVGAYSYQSEIGSSNQSLISSTNDPDRYLPNFETTIIAGGCKAFYYFLRDEIVWWGFDSFEYKTVNGDWDLIPVSWFDSGMDNSMCACEINDDIDGDGIINSLDLDSDGDGCPDAIEGGGTFTLDDLQNSGLPGGNFGATYTGIVYDPVTQNLGNNVDTVETGSNYGVPVIIGGGQDIGTSQDASIIDEECIDYFPTAIDDFVQTNENTPVYVNVLSNDSFGDDGPSTGTITLIETPLNGTVTLDDGGTPDDPTDDQYYYEPFEGFSGFDQFVYEICDEDGDCAVATVSIQVFDEKPLPVDDVAYTEEDTPVTIDVLANDSFGLDGPSLGSITVVEPPINGNVVVDDGGTPLDPSDDQLIYTPNAGYTGYDQIVYEICDATGDCEMATVGININEEIPVAIDDATETEQNTSVLVDVLTNDNFGLDGPNSGTITIVEMPLNGTAIVNDGGTPNDPTDDMITYTPNVDYVGPDQLVYQICDATNDCTTATLNINVTNCLVNPNNDCDNDGLINSVEIGIGTDPLNPDTDEDGITDGIEVNNGSEPLNPCDPNPDAIPSADCGEPQALDDITQTNENTSVNILVLDNDTFGIDGPNNGSIQIISNPLNGTVIVDDGGTPNDPTDDEIIYTPNTNFNGFDQVVYQICDEDGDCDEATVSISVTNCLNNPNNDCDNDGLTNAEEINVTGTDPLNPDTDGDDLSDGTEVGINSEPLNPCSPNPDAIPSANCGVPQAIDEIVGTPENTLLTIDVLFNDNFGIDGPSIGVINIIDPPIHGTAYVDDGGTPNDPTDDTIIYEPDTDYVGDDQIVYQICDEDGDCDLATVSINVTNCLVNPNDDCDEDGLTNGEEISLGTDPLEPDTDGDGLTDNEEVIGLTDPLNPCDPNPNTVTDANCGVPIAEDDIIETPENTSVNVPVLDNDTFGIDGSSIGSIIITANPLNGTATIDDGGTPNDPTDDEVVYIPNDDFNGFDQVVYQICDLDGDCETATVSVNVTNCLNNPNNDCDNDGISNADEINIYGTNPLNPDTDEDGITDGNEVSNGSEPLNPCDPNPNAIAEANCGIPIAVDDVAETSQNEPITISILDNDTFGIDAPSIGSITIITNPLNGTVTINDGGTPNDPTDDQIIYTPNEDFVGFDQLVYQICDEDGDCDNATVSINITGSIPIAIDDFIQTNENVGVEIDVLANDNFGEDGPITGTISIIEMPLNGVAYVDTGDDPFDPTDDVIMYEPNEGYTGFDQLVYLICDASNDCVEATVSINVMGAGLNAIDDAVETAENIPVTINPLSNDTFGPDGPSEGTITIIESPINGIATVNDNGTPNDPSDDLIIYNPDTGFTGFDQIVYQICDATNDCDEATISINVIGVGLNAIDDAVETNEDVPVIIDVLINDDFGPDGPSVGTITILEYPINGDATVHNGGTPNDPTDDQIVYVPNDNFNGFDQIVYQICDATGDCVEATISITVIGVGPTAVDDIVETEQNSPISIDVLDNDSFGNDGPNYGSITIIDIPINGIAYVDNGGTPLNPTDDTIVYTPNAGFTGFDQLVYEICDLDGDCEMATVSITVVGSCDETIECPPLEVCTPAMTAILICPDYCVAGEFIITEVNSLYHCSVELQDDCFEYIPLPGMEFVGTDLIEFTAESSSGTCITGTVNIAIGSCNEPPIAVDDYETTSGSISINVLDNDSDANGDLLYICDNGNANNGDVNVVGNNIVYTPNTGFSGVDSFTYTICDGNGSTSTATVYVTVEFMCENDDLYLCTEHMQAVTICPEFCLFEDGTPYAIVQANTSYSCSIYQLNDECIRYTPLPGYFGQDVINIIACGTESGMNNICDTVTVHMNVLEDCNPPACNANQEHCIGHMEEVLLCVDFCNQDADIVNVNTTYNCSINQLEDNCITYRPLPAFYGTEEIEVEGCDQAGSCETAILTIHVDEDCGQLGGKNFNSLSALCDLEVPNVFVPDNINGGKLYLSNYTSCFETSKVVFEVYSLTGQLLYNNKNVSSSALWDANQFRHWSNGTYLFKVTIIGNVNKQKVGRIILMK